ncbi:MAG: hypothetical protein ACI8W8_002346, partial [Rhodothermales bacterium]
VEGNLDIIATPGAFDVSEVVANLDLGITFRAKSSCRHTDIPIFSG